MWCISAKGFVSLVEHNEDPELIRARARRREHLTDTFDLLDSDVIDFGPNAPDYQFHADVPRTIVAQAMHDAVMNLSYSSHVKEEVSGPDNVMYRAMLDCWTALMRLQRPPKLADDDWWTDPALYDKSYADAVLDNWDDTLGPEPEIHDHVARLADKMLSGSADSNPDRPALKVYEYRGHHPDICSICGDDIDMGDEYVVTPRGFTDVGDPGGPTHADCLEDEIDLDYTEVVK